MFRTPQRNLTFLFKKQRIVVCRNIVTSSLRGKQLTFLVDAQFVGRIVSDMTHLKNKNLLPIVEPQRDGEGELRGRRHYRIEYDIIPIVKGTDLIWEVGWPSSDTLKNVDSDRKRRRLEKYQFKQTAQLSLAPAFMPGTN